MRTILFFLLGIVVVFPVVSNLLRPGYFTSDDGEWMVVRFSSFYEELRHGQFPVRYLHRLNYGYGYPVATFLYPGFMYVASVFKVIGFGFMSSVKLVFIVSIVSAFAGSFLWLTTHFTKKSAFFGSLLFIYHPYFLYDVYKRGSVGEVLAMGVLPVVLYFLSKRAFVPAAFATAFLIVSHNTLALFFIPLVIAYAAVIQLGWKWLTTYLLLSLGISSFFWVPALSELPLTVFRQTTVSNWHNYFVTDIFLVGIVPGILGLVTVACSYKERKHFLVWLFVAILVSGIALSLPVSSFLWNWLPLGKLVQFPFRFLSLVVPAVAFCGAYVSDYLKKSPYQTAIVVFLATSTIVLSFRYSTYHQKDVDDLYYQTNEATTTVQHEYMPVWVTTIPNTHYNSYALVKSPGTVQLSTIYWPGHHVLVNGIEVAATKNPDGLIEVPAKSSADSFTVKLKETPNRVAADIISLVSGISVFFVRKRFYV